MLKLFFEQNEDKVYFQIIDLGNSFSKRNNRKVTKKKSGKSYQS